MVWHVSYEAYAFLFIWLFEALLFLAFMFLLFCARTYFLFDILEYLKSLHKIPSFFFFHCLVIPLACFWVARKCNLNQCVRIMYLMVTYHPLWCLVTNSTFFFRHWLNIRLYQKNADMKFFLRKSKSVSLKLKPSLGHHWNSVKTKKLCRRLMCQVVKVLFLFCFAVHIFFSLSDYWYVIKYCISSAKVVCLVFWFGCVSLINTAVISLCLCTWTFFGLLFISLHLLFVLSLHLTDVVVACNAFRSSMLHFLKCSTMKAYGIDTDRHIQEH